MLEIRFARRDISYFKPKFYFNLSCACPKRPVCHYTGDLLNAFSRKYTDLRLTQYLEASVVLNSKSTSTSSVVNDSNYLEFGEIKKTKSGSNALKKRKKKGEEKPIDNLLKKKSKSLKNLEEEESASPLEENENLLAESSQKKRIKSKRYNQEHKESISLEERLSDKASNVGPQKLKIKSKKDKDKFKSNPEEKNSVKNASKSEIDMPSLPKCAYESDTAIKHRLIESLKCIHKQLRREKPTEDQRYEIKNRIDIVDSKLCDDVLQRLMLSLDEYKGCDLIDLNPGACLWSSKLHDALQPRDHILVEPHHDSYFPILKPLLEKVDSKYQLVKGNGVNWNDLAEVLSSKYLPKQPILNTGDPRLKQINNTLLVTGNIASHPTKGFLGFSSLGSLVLYQFLSAIRTNALFQRYGNVRMLLWINPCDGKLVPRNIAGRKKSSLEASISCQHIEFVVDADQIPHKKREKRLDIERATSVLKKMEENGVKIPEGRETRMVKAIRAGETGSEIEELSPKCLQKELQDMKEAYAQGNFGKNKTSKLQGSRAQRTNEYKRMCELERRNGRTVSKTLLLFELADKFENILLLYKKLKLATDATEVKAIEEVLRAETVAFKSGMEPLSAIDIAAAQFICDNRRIFHQTPPGLFWDRREAEPMTAREDEFYPNQVLSLLDVKPGFLPSISDNTEFHDTLSFITMQMCLIPTQSLKTALENLAPGADEWLLAECPSLTDPLRNGCPDLDLFSTRCITVEMVVEICEAWLKWPFRPSRGEILHRLGAEAYYEKVD